MFFSIFMMHIYRFTASFSSRYRKADVESCEKPHDKPHDSVACRINFCCNNSHESLSAGLYKSLTCLWRIFDARFLKMLIRFIDFFRAFQSGCDLNFEPLQHFESFVDFLLEIIMLLRDSLLTLTVRQTDL